MKNDISVMQHVPYMLKDCSVVYFHYVHLPILQLMAAHIAEIFRTDSMSL